jgi:hypothetical protein
VEGKEKTLVQQGTGNREQGTGNREQGTGNREQGGEFRGIALKIAQIPLPLINFKR